MRFLADESCDLEAVRALRDAGHDVVALAESSPRLPDSEVLALAVRADRTLLSEDQYFGKWAFAGAAARTGVVLLRYRQDTRPDLGKTVVDLVARYGVNLRGRCTVLDRSSTFRQARPPGSRPPG